MNKLQKKTGLILTEALFAIALLAIGGIVLGTIMDNSIRATFISKNYLTAQSLATESIEAVKNIRDTNWLMNPSVNPDSVDFNAPMYWLCLSPSRNCETGIVAETGANYIASQSATRQWILTKHSQNSDLDLAGDDLNANEYILFLSPEIPNATGFQQYVTGTLPTGYQSEIYYRSVKFLSAGPDSAEIEVKVEWRENTRIRSVTRVITLYNYLQ